MSIEYDYEVSKRISNEDYPFYALIMAAMRQADTENIARLQLVFPAVYEEAYSLYNTGYRGSKKVDKPGANDTVGRNSGGEDGEK